MYLNCRQDVCCFGFFFYLAEADAGDYGPCGGRPHKIAASAVFVLQAHHG